MSPPARQFSAYTLILEFGKLTKFFILLQIAETFY